MASVAPRYIQIVTEIAQWFMPDSSEEAMAILKEVLETTTDDLASVAQEKVDLLGDKCYQQFNGALSSFRGFNMWVFEAIQKGGIEAHTLVTMDALVAEPFLRAAISITAIACILNETLTDWLPDSIPLLCSAADNYMTKVEDAFLEVSYLPTPEEELVDYADLRRSLGL